MTLTRRQFAVAAFGTLGSARAATTSTDPVAIDLVAAKTWVSLDGRLVELITYNGEVPGPTITLRPGQELAIRLRNLLSDPTNLHFHGLHLPPSPGPDDPFRQIAPGEEHEYRFTLPANHSGGTFWYHPHVHGYTAEQVGGGLAGAILVRSELEDAAELSRLPEVVLMLQDFDLTGDGTLARPSGLDAMMMGREGALVTASGRTSPSLAITSGGFVRIRLINASSSRFYNLQLDEHPFVLIGVDGGLLPYQEERDTILLSPGERVDAVVRGNRNPGEYRLLSLPYSRATGMGMGAMMPSGNRPIEVAKLVYQPDSSQAPWQLPGRLNSIEALPAARMLRRFTLGQAIGGMGMGGGGGQARGSMAFTINGRRFDMDRVDTSVQVGDIEDWEFLNNTTMDHPMHVHTNPFQRVGADGNVEPAWKDTVLVKAGQRVRVRTRFDDFTGLSVYHCHILDHEDAGMMGTLRISLTAAEFKGTYRSAAGDRDLYGSAPGRPEVVEFRVVSGRRYRPYPGFSHGVAMVTSVRHGYGLAGPPLHVRSCTSARTVSRVNHPAFQPHPARC